MVKTKKIISLLLSFIMIMSVFTIVPFTANAAEAEAAATAKTEGDYKYRILSDGTAEITKYTGEGGDVTIPSTLGGYTVSRIGYEAFSGCTSLTSIDIPDSVTSIGSGAFYDTAWYNNQPDGLVYAGKVAYKMKGDCPSEIVIKDGTLGIAGSAFYGCTGLTSVTIPDSVTSIDGFAFEGCTGLTSVTIPDSVTSIGYGAFAWCTSLTSIKVAEGNTVYDSRDNCNAIIETESNTIIIGFKSTVIPNSVTSIGDSAFYGCTGLTSIDIPDSVTFIEDGAFFGCRGLTSVTIPDSVTSIGGGAFSDCSGLTSVTIPDSVTSIGGGAFSGCTSLTSIDIPDSVTSIGESAFSDCTGLTSIDIPDSVTSIGDYAFAFCESITRIDIPDSVTSIGDSAFRDCTGLTSVTIPDSVTSIDYSAFGYYYDDDGNTSKIDGFTIYGYEGSEAEWYAKDDEFTFVPLKSKADKETGIVLDIPENIELSIKDITADISSKLPDGCNVLTAYDISLTKDGETVQPENVVTVKIPCTNENAKVYRHEADSTMTDMNAKYKDGYMVFTTDHFSVYVLAEPEPEVVTVKGDVTGDGKTNVQDCTAILRYVRKLDTLSEDQLKRADVTGDGKVNVQDVTRILRHVRKIETLY